MTKNCWEPVAPARFATGTPFERGLSPVEAVTVTEAVAVRVAPEDPVAVKVAAPAGAVAAAVSVSVELPPAVTDVGLKRPVTPVGNPDTDSAMVCVLPLSADVVTL
jgi:hypothetical protein